MENNNSDYFINPDGIKLFRLIYKPSGSSTKAIVFICHGLFEHCRASYYELIIKPLTDIGCLVVSHDHRGHGLSEGERGMIFDFNSLVRDVILDIDEVVTQHQIPKDIPVFLYGHSMGGLISVHASLHRKDFFKGMILEAPALCLPKQLGKGTIFFGKVMNKLFPSASVGKGKPNDVCRNIEYVKEIKNDKLRIHRGVPARTAMSIMKAIKETEKVAKDVNTPFIIGHGDGDRICPIQGSKYLVEKSLNSDKTLLSFPNAKHQLKMEIDGVNIEFSGKIVHWINEKINNHENQIEQ